MTPCKSWPSLIPGEAELVQLLYFAGLTLPEAARTLDISPRTASRLWAFARAWLREEIEGEWKPGAELLKIFGKPR